MPPLVHRPPGRGGGGGLHAKTLVLTVALLLLLASTSQQQSLHQPKEHPTLVASTHKPHSSAHSKDQAGRSPPEIPLLKHDIATVKFRSTEDDATHQNYNALAPARNPSAVRAPLAHPVESAAGLSALSQARLLQDWEAADMVLLATVDGRIQARNRRTGEELWAMGFDDSPMIQTIHHCHNNTDDDESRCDHDYMFIVEPTRDGTLYIQYKDPEMRLQRLDVSVKELAAETPNFLDNPPLVTIAQQETSAVTVNAETGEVLQQFSKHAMGFSNNERERKCRRITGLESDEDACDTKGNINLGRVEYTIQIANKITSEILCTIKYAEWVPNKADGDLQMQYTVPLDSLHIQTKYNGRIIGLDHTSQRIQQWHDKLESPVAQVFDVIKPVGEDEDANLVLLTRPLNSPSHIPAPAWQNDFGRLEKVFVDKTPAGMWYALSELAYPGVTAGADRARINWDPDSFPLDFLEKSEDLIGVHTITAGEHEAPIRLTIDPSPPEKDIMLEGQKGLNSSPHAALNTPKPSISDHLPSMMNIILLSIILLIGGSKVRIPAVQKLYQFLSKVPLLDSFVDQNTNPSATSVAVEVEEIVVPTAPEKPEVTAAAVTAEMAELTETTSAVAIHSRNQSDEIPEISPKKPGKDESNENSSEDESDAEKAEANAAPNGEVEVKAKRKTKRGKRGGRKNNKKKQMSPEAIDDAAMVMETVKDGMLQVGKLKIDTREDCCLGKGSNGTTVFPGILDGREVAVKRLIKSSNSLAAKEIKHLLSSDENPHVIRFIGKEESPHFTYIALDLFTTSLDQFVEKPLQYPSLVKMPEGYDVKDCLQQITDGVSHLHSLKLVHRDIKPQNVLVKSIKTNRPTSGLPKLHFVISDFGLAKPLEEGPESTFAPTANHTAAGTTGWRAPELLVNYSGLPVPTSSSTASTSHSLDGNRDSSNGNLLNRHSGRRATKAIDIFSLGCVFYYVMTQGRHPFDVGGTSLGRDLNIKEGRLSTDDLRLHNYQFDADDLIMQMLKPDPRDRPDTQAVLKHPYFWSHETKLEFLCDVSDCYEKEKNSIKNIHDADAVRTEAELESLKELAALEGLSVDVIAGGDWLKALPKTFLNEMGKQRKYTGSKMIDLLRVVRNKKNHFHDLPEDVKAVMLSLGRKSHGGFSGDSGGSVELGEHGNPNTNTNTNTTKGQEITKGYYEFWAKRFPSLLVNCHMLILQRELVARMGLGRYY